MYGIVLCIVLYCIVLCTVSITDSVNVIVIPAGTVSKYNRGKYTLINLLHPHFLKTSGHSESFTGDYQADISTSLVYFPLLHLLTVPAGITITFTELVILTVPSCEY